jgi:hypothetical protein
VNSVSNISYHFWKFENLYRIQIIFFVFLVARIEPRVRPITSKENDRVLLKETTFYHKNKNPAKTFKGPFQITKITKTALY